VVDGRWGSNIYEVNQWLWRFGRGKLHLIGLTGKQSELGWTMQLMNKSSVEQRLAGIARLIESY
jgi:hypothetical protein